VNVRGRGTDLRIRRRRNVVRGSNVDLLRMDRLGL
jgi:hypothetical protein